jgi:hypothetical protein
VDPSSPAALGVGVGALLVGYVLGYLVSRRGRRLKVDWRLTVETDDHPDPEPDPDPEADA